MKPAADKPKREVKLSKDDSLRFSFWERPRCRVCDGLEFRQMRAREYSDDGQTVTERVECKRCGWRGILIGT